MVSQRKPKQNCACRKLVQYEFEDPLQVTLTHDSFADVQMSHDESPDSQMDENYALDSMKIEPRLFN